MPVQTTGWFTSVEIMAEHGAMLLPIFRIGQKTVWFGAYMHQNGMEQKHIWGLRHIRLAISIPTSIGPKTTVKPGPRSPMVFQITY